MTAELSLAASQVVALRSAMVLCAGGDPRTRREMTRMWTEKVHAWQESMLALGLQVQRAQQAWLLQSMRMWLAWPPGIGARLAHARLLEQAAAGLVRKGIAPAHRRATANARRLSRRPQWGMPPTRRRASAHSPGHG